MTWNTNLGSDLYTKQPSYNMDRHPGTLKDESSLFSSSLSDLFSQKLRLSMSESRFLHSALDGNSQNDVVGPLKHVEETQAQTMKNLLPDEEELLSGVIDDVGIVAQANSAGEESEDFDLFSCSGGIELEADDHKLAGNGNMGFVKHITNRQWGHNSTVAAANNAAHFYNPTKLLNAVGVRKGSLIHDTYGVCNSFQPPIANNQLNLCQSSNCSPSLLNSDNRYIGNFQPHSLPKIHNHLSNGIPWRSLESMVDCVAEYPPTTGDINRDLNVCARSLNGGGFGYTTNGFQIPQSLPSKSEPYEHQLLSSMAWANSPPSFMNSSSSPIHSHIKLPLFLSPPHAMMNSVSPPPLNLHVGSAPVVNSSSLLWNQKGESFEDLSFRSSPVHNLATVPSQSPSNHQIDSSSYRSLIHAGMDMPKNGGLLPPQQKSHMFHERNPSISTPSSFGFPNERFRSHASFDHLSEKKSFELNIDRILRGEDGRTTLMIKNIPNKYTSKMLLATIDEHHKGQYDFIYLPIDFKNKCNVGYAFINMIDPLHIVPFYQTFNGKRWEKFNSEKVACLAYARIQGKAALIAHFQNSSLMNEDKRCRPILFHTDGPNAGNQEPFPIGSNPRTRPGTGRLQNE